MANTDYDKLPDHFYVRYKIGYTTNSVDYDAFIKDKTINNDSQIDITDARANFPIEYSDYTEVKEVSIGLRSIPKGRISLLNESDKSIQTIESTNNQYKFKVKISDWEQGFEHVLNAYPVNSFKCYLIFPTSTIDVNEIDGNTDKTIVNNYLSNLFNNSNLPYSFTPSDVTTNGQPSTIYNGSYNENRVNYDITSDLITVTADEKFISLTGYLIIYVNRSGIDSPLMCKQISLVNKAFSSSNLFLKPTKSGLEKTDPYVNVYDSTGNKDLTVNYNIVQERSPIVRLNIEIADNNTNPVSGVGYTNISMSYTKWKYSLINKLNQDESIISETYGIDFFRTIFGPMFNGYFEKHDLIYGKAKHSEEEKRKIYKAYYRLSDGSRLLEDLLNNNSQDSSDYSTYFTTMMNKSEEVSKNPENYGEDDKREVNEFMDKVYSTLTGIFINKYYVQKHMLSGNYSLKLTADLYSKDDLLINSFSTDIEISTFSKYNDCERNDLWASTIYKLPYLEHILFSEREDIYGKRVYENIYNNKTYLNRTLITPYNPLNSNLEPLGHSESLITGFTDMNGSSIGFHDEITPYHFSLFDNDKNFKYTVFDNLDQLVDMLYSLTIRTIDRHGVEYYFKGDFTYTSTDTSMLYYKITEEDINRFNQYVLRNTIVIYCNADNFKQIEDLKTNSSIKSIYSNLIPNDVNLYKNVLMSDGKYNRISKQEIKDFLISKNFTPEYFKANKDTVNRRLAIEAYGADYEIPIIGIPLFTEAVCVVFREEIDDMIFKGHDGYLNDVIDLTPTTDKNYVDYPKDLLGDIDALKHLGESLTNISAIYSDSNNQRMLHSGIQPIADREINENTPINDYSTMLASQFKLFKANFDLMGVIPFRACTDKSLLGFKGEFVHRVEGYKKGQEVVHPITKDLYLCIKDRPGYIDQGFGLREENYNSLSHNYPVGTPTYTVLDEEKYFVKVKSLDNLSGLSEEDYRKYYKSSLPTYVSLLSYLNLLIGAHEGLICPPIHQDLIQGYTDMITNGNQNPYSLFSYNRIYQKLNKDCIGDTSGLLKEGIKQHDKSPMGSNEEPGLEEIFIEYTNFPYHFLDGYFNETENTDFNNHEHIKENENLTDDEETLNAIKDVMYGSWIKLRNKNYHNIIYVSSRPVFWTKNVELIAGSNILHPRQHIIRIGTKHYYVRIVTDNFFEDDDCCRDEIIFNNISTCDPDFQTFNDPDRINFRESLLTPLIMSQCEIASSNTKLMKRTGKLNLDTKYSYPESNPVFTIDFKNIVTDNSIRQLNKDTLCIHHIPALFRIEEKKTEIQTDLNIDMEFSEVTKFRTLEKGILIYNSNISPDHYFNYNRDRSMNFTRKELPMPNLIYNLERSRGFYELPLQFTFRGEYTSDGSTIDITETTGIKSPWVTTGYDYIYFNNVNNTGFKLYYKENDSSTTSDIFIFETLLMTNQNFRFFTSGPYSSDAENYTDMQPYILGTSTFGSNLSIITFTTDYGCKTFPMFNTTNTLDRILETPRPPEMGVYTPVHIVLEAIEEDDLPIYNLKSEFQSLFNEINKNDSNTTFDKAVNDFKTIDSVLSQDLNKDYYDMRIHIDKVKDNIKNSLSTATYYQNNTSPKYNKATKEITIPKIMNGGYYMDLTYDVDYTLTDNTVSSLTNYTISHSGYIHTPDTFYNNNHDKAYRYLDRMSYGNYNYEDAVSGNWGHYKMQRNVHNTRYSYDRWNGTGYLGQFDGLNCKDLGLEYNTIFQQLDQLGLPRKQNLFNDDMPGYNDRMNIDSSKFMDYYNKSTPIIHVYYFKGKVVLIPSWTPYDLYDMNMYGSVWRPEFDHLEVGRSKPIDRLTSRTTRVKIGSYNFDVFLPYLANDRSLHSNQELVKHVMPTFKYTK